MVKGNSMTNRWSRWRRGGGEGQQNRLEGRKNNVNVNEFKTKNMKTWEIYLLL